MNHTTLQKYKDKNSMTEGHPDVKPHPMRTAILIFVIMAAGFAVYSDSLHAPFLLDDNVFIVSDNAKHMTELSWKNIAKAAFEGQPQHRYLPNISLALNYYSGGLDTTGYHLVNIAIHLLAGVFLFLFIQNTLAVYAPLSMKPGGRPSSGITGSDAFIIAFFAALLWMVHPVNTQSVTYLCQRMTSMVALFYILSLYLYAKGRMVMRQARPGCMARAALIFAGCALAGVCAVATKENAGTLPLVLLLYEWFFFQDLKIFRSKRQWLLALAALAFFSLIAVLYLGIDPLRSIMAGYAHRNFTLPQRVMTEFRVIIYYISLFFWPSPSRLNLDHDYPLSFSLINPWTTLLCLTALIALMAVTVLRARKDRLVSFCILWFFINLLIESSIIGIEIIFEHRTYLPFMMISLLVTFLVIRHMPRQAAFAVLGLAAALSGLWTFQRNHAWTDEIAFYRDCAQKSPGKARPLLNLATALRMHGNIHEAGPLFLQILHLDPDNIDACNNLGNIYAEQNRLNKAFQYYTKALSVFPDSVGYKPGEAASAEFNIGSILLGHGMNEEAAYHLAEGLKLNPENAEAENRLGMALMATGKLKEAETHFQRAVQMDPENAGAAKNLNSATAILQNAPESAEQPRPVVLHPENAPLHLLLARLYQRQKRFQEAIRQYQKVLLMHPDDTKALAGLGKCFDATGDTAKSLLVRQRLMMELKPDNAMKTGPDSEKK